MNTLEDFSIEKVLPSRKDLEFWEPKGFINKYFSKEEKEQNAILLTNCILNICGNSSKQKFTENELCLSLVSNIFDALTIKYYINFGILQSFTNTVLINNQPCFSEACYKNIKYKQTKSTKFTYNKTKDEFIFDKNDHKDFIDTNTKIIVDAIHKEILDDLCYKAKVIPAESKVENSNICITGIDGIDFLKSKGFQTVELTNEIKNCSLTPIQTGNSCNKGIFYSKYVKDILFIDGGNPTYYFHIYNLFSPISEEDCRYSFAKGFINGNSYQKIIL